MHFLMSGFFQGETDAQWLWGRFVPTCQRRNHRKIVESCDSGHKWCVSAFISRGSWCFWFLFVCLLLWKDEQLKTILAEITGKYEKRFPTANREHWCPQDHSPRLGSHQNGPCRRPVWIRHGIGQLPQKAWGKRAGPSEGIYPSSGGFCGQRAGQWPAGQNLQAEFGQGSKAQALRLQCWVWWVHFMVTSEAAAAQPLWWSWPWCFKESAWDCRPHIRG